MKDKNGIKLKHGTPVKVEFVAENLPTIFHIGYINHNKIRVLKPEEKFSEYYKIKSIEKLNFSDYPTGKYNGLKCDNKECNWIDNTITEEQYPDYINATCPCCGETLLTIETYENVLKNKFFLQNINDIVSQNFIQKENLSSNRSVAFLVKEDGNIDFSSMEEYDTDLSER